MLQTLGDNTSNQEDFEMAYKYEQYCMDCIDYEQVVEYFPEANIKDQGKWNDAYRAPVGRELDEDIWVRYVVLVDRARATW